MKSQNAKKNSISKSVYNLHGKNPARRPESSLQIKVISTVGEFMALEPEWNELVDKSDVTVFQTFEWNRAWWKHFGVGKKLYIITLYDSQCLMGILPLFIDTFDIFGKRCYSCLRFLGSIVSQPDGEDLHGFHAYSDYLDAIIRPGFENLFYTQLLGYLNGCTLSYHEIILEEIPEQSSLLTNFLLLLDENEISYSVSKDSVCPIIKLEKSWDEYLAKLSQRTRSHIRTLVKKVNKDDNKVFDIKPAGDLETMLRAYDKLVELHQEKWNKIGYPGAFTEKRFYKFLSEATMVLWRKGLAELRLAKSADRNHDIIAVDLLFKFKDEVYLVYRAHDVDLAGFDTQSLDELLYQGVKNAMEEQRKVFAFLRGAEEYKSRLANNKRQNKVIKIVHPGKNWHLSSPLIKILISAKRRFKLELEQTHIVFRDKKIFRGLRDYCSLVYRRFRSKI